MEIKLTESKKKKQIEEDFDPMDIEYLLVGKTDSCEIS